ncbi:MAG: adenylate/guanylate cyclase domain-containing protein [Anaerolineae bacterium]
MADLSPYHALRDYLARADERAVYRAWPRHIARQLNLEPHTALEALVEAMFAGDAILHWEIVCPACGAQNEETDWLRRARHDYVCAACGGSFAPHLDREVQVTFSPHPTLRALSLTAPDPEFLARIHQQFAPTTAHELLTVQRFRDWARDEPLPDGEYLEVGRAVIWFSDLTGSTALYARNGDPLAYQLVRQHFDLVFGAIQDAQGAVVKTMGDGVMGVFTSAERGLRAALAAHQALAGFNTERALSGDRRLALKIGMHMGPTITVTLNERLDYFGTTVNVAARAADLARGGETVFTEALLVEEGAQAIIAGRAVESFRASVRGLDQELTHYRLTW